MATAKARPKTPDLAGIGVELDRLSFLRLEAQRPELVREIESAVGNGATPEDVRRYALRRRMPPEWVSWLESAARAASLA